MEKHEELARKLKALADRGIGGEKTNAEAMLKALLEKHKLTIEDIDGEQKKDYYLTIEKTDNYLLHPLLRQVVKHCNIELKLFGEFPDSEVYKHSLPGNFMIRCTASEFIEIDAKFRFYSSLYKEEYNVFWYAFLQANSLLIINHNKTLSADEWLEWNRVNELSSKITIGNFKAPQGNKLQLPSGNEKDK